MTREEILHGLENIAAGEGLYDDRKPLKRALILGEAIKAIEQEPCEDAISRQAVLEVLKDKWNMFSDANDAMQESIDTIEALRPVTAEPKTGHWIEEINDYGEVTGWHCDKCYEDSGFTTTCKWDFCPNCGAKMVEPQESKVEE